MTSKGERQKFSDMIELTAVRSGITHIEAILQHCEDTGLEVDMVGSLVTTALKQKLEQEAIQQRSLKSNKSSVLVCKGDMNGKKEEA